VYFVNLAKKDADIKLKLKLPSAPKVSSNEIKTDGTSNTVQVPVIQLERVDESMKEAQRAELPTTSDEEEILNSENETDVDKLVDHDYSVDDFIIEEEAEINSVIYDPNDPLGLNKISSVELSSTAPAVSSSTAPAVSNQITVTAQVHAPSEPSVPKTVASSLKTYENATQAERDQMVYDHIQNQNKEINLLKDTVAKLLDEKKSFMKQQTELICDMNLLKERLRIAEDAEEVEVIRARIKELQKQSLLNKIKTNEKANEKSKTVNEKSKTVHFEKNCDKTND